MSGISSLTPRGYSPSAMKSIFFEIERRGVYTEAQAGGVWAVGEHVA
jgi:hypothetical protein